MHRGRNPTVRVQRTGECHRILEESQQARESREFPDVSFEGLACRLRGARRHTRRTARKCRAGFAQVRLFEPFRSVPVPDSVLELLGLSSCEMAGLTHNYLKTKTHPLSHDCNLPTPSACITLGPEARSSPLRPGGPARLLLRVGSY